MRPPSACIAILIPLVLLACRDDDDDLDGQTGSGEARLHLDVSHLDLGTLDAGQSASAELILASVGDATIYIGDITLVGPAVFDVDWPGTEVSLPPGDSLTVTMTFEPQTDTNYDATLVIDSNDASSPTTGVSLSGVGIAPVIQLTPPTHDFGDEEVGCLEEVDITVRNVGSVPLVVEEIVLSPTSDELLMTSSLPPGTMLAPQQTGIVTIRYLPRDEIPDTGYLHVYSNDPRTPDALATQTGTAHYGGVVVDEFEQYDEMTDILWALDTSCSMSDEQPNLMDNFASFIDILGLLGIDYHVAVISTQASPFQGEIPIITSTTPDAHAAFAEAISLDIGGSHGQAILMALSALTPPETDPGGPNHGFLRDYATLRIVFISDKDDYSPDDVTTWVTQLQALKINPDWVVLNGVTGQTTGCSSAVGDAQASPRYEQAIDMTGGISASLCAENWIGTLFNSESMGNPTNTLELSQTPVENTIEVEIDGVPTYVGWTYDAALNSLVFEPGHAPNVGDRTTIAYHRLGSCY